MILNDTNIHVRILKKEIGIYPYDETMLQPASLDIKLSGEIGFFKTNLKRVNVYPGEAFSEFTETVDVKDKETFPELNLVEYEEDQPILIEPSQFILARTLEYFEFPSNLAGKVEGRSSLGRLGLQIHSTAGFIDPGFKGFITLELHNLSKTRIILYKNMKIGQIAFHTLLSPAQNPYGSESLDSKYQDSQGIGGSKYYADYTTNE